MAEGHHQLVDAGLRGEADVLEALVDGVDRRILLLVDGLHVLLATNVGFVDLLAVDRDDQRVLELHVVDPQGLGHVGDVEHVLAVGREVVVHGDAAARAQRQAFLVEELGAGVPGPVGRAGRQRVLVAHGLHDHAARGTNVLVEEGRGDLQRLRVVVEAIARLVARQQGRGVDVDVQQVAHRVGVFLAVEAMQAHVTRVGVALGRGVEAGLHPRHEGAGQLLFGHLVAAGRHLLAAQLADDLFHDLRVLRDLALGHGVEGHAAGPVFGVMALRAVFVQECPGRHARAAMRGSPKGKGGGGEQHRCAKSAKNASPHSHGCVPAPINALIQAKGAYASGTFCTRRAMPGTVPVVLPRY